MCSTRAYMAEFILCKRGKAARGARNATSIPKTQIRQPLAHQCFSQSAAPSTLMLCLLSRKTQGVGTGAAHMRTVIVVQSHTRERLSYECYMFARKAQRTR